MFFNDKKIYFSAGPAKIPQDVMNEAHNEFLDYKGTGISVMEISHRSKTFLNIITEAEKDLRALLGVPENYTILFMHGGAQTQFSSIPMNLGKNVNDGDNEKCHAEYIVTGNWSEKASEEAKKYITAVKPEDNVSESKLAYRYFCDNETIQGVEFCSLPQTTESVPLVCDMTSNFLSRPVDVSKYGVIVASAQKNVGMAGLAIVIARNDLIGKAMKICPSVQDWAVMKKNKSNYNTPPVYPIYMAGLCFKWIIKHGGLSAMDKASCEKANLIYETIDNSQNFYGWPATVGVEMRSRMNVVFRITKFNLADKDLSNQRNEELEKRFLAEAEEHHLYDLKGHRNVGGLRASLYHGVTLEDVKCLKNFMDYFKEKYYPSL